MGVNVSGEREIDGVGEIPGVGVGETSIMGTEEMIKFCPLKLNKSKGNILNVFARLSLLIIE